MTKRINLTTMPSSDRHPLHGPDLKKVVDLHDIGLPGGGLELTVGKEAYEDAKYEGEGISFVEWNYYDEGLVLKVEVDSRSGSVKIVHNGHGKVSLSTSLSIPVHVTKETTI